jgi:hypothetical protein
MIPSQPPPCPDPLARAARAGARTDWLRLPPASLQGALVAVAGRDTRGVALDDVQRLSHFPSTPLVTLSWFRDVDVGQVRQGARGVEWQPFGAPCVVSGSQAHPSTTWAPTTGHGCMAFFRADAAQALFGLDLAQIQDRFVPAGDAMGAEWTPFWGALRASADNDLIDVLDHHLARRCRRCADAMATSPRCASSAGTGSNASHGRRTSGAASTARATSSAASSRSAAVRCASGRPSCARKACSSRRATAMRPASHSTGPPLRWTRASPTRPT